MPLHAILGGSWWLGESQPATAENRAILVRSDGEGERLVSHSMASRNQVGCPPSMKPSCKTTQRSK